MLETCVKNCGHRFHVLVANRDFIDGVLVKIISPKNNPPTIVQDKVLALIQVHSLSVLPYVAAWNKDCLLQCYASLNMLSSLKNVASFLYVKTNNISRLAGKSRHAHAEELYPGRNVWILVGEITLYSETRGLKDKWVALQFNSQI